MRNIKIKGIEVYYPDYVKSTDEIIEKYKESDEDIELEVKEFFGKENLRLSAEAGENTLTMSVKAAEKVLKSAGLNGSDIDMIILSSMLPEYLSPPTSTLIHRAIKGKKSAVCYDMNANCVGMTITLDQVSKMMKGDEKLNKVLLIGCDVISSHVKKDDPMMNAILGDAACAVILERTNEDIGIIDSRHYIDSMRGFPEAAFPICGVSNIYENDEGSRRLQFGAQEPEINLIAEYIKDMLDKNELKIEDISMFCFSQFSRYFIEYLRNALSIPEEKSWHVAGDIGYTGTNSPFIVLNNAIKEQRVKRGDYIFIWTLGIGEQYIFLLLRY